MTYIILSQVRELADYPHPHMTLCATETGTTIAGVSRGNAQN